jgi:UDPglucose 6-dehydrogenase
MKLAMIGVGYVGLVSGVGFSQFGNEVICADIDKNKIDQLNRLESPIYEPELDQLLIENVESKRLTFTTDVHEAIAQADVVFIAVGTPQATDGSADLSYVMATARTIGEVLRKTKQPNKVVVVKSTVPVGTTKIVEKIITSYSNAHCCVASNPEFLREGTAVEDFLRPDRVVIGTTCAEARDILTRLYKPLAAEKIHVMDPASSELVKYASNAFLAVRISYMNELSHLASVLGADIDKIRIGMGSDPRIGPQYLYPGPGYGGSCLPKDVAALQHMADVVGLDFQIVNSAQKVNTAQRHLLGALVSKDFGSLKGKKICVWGAAFKAETDDIRESPAIDFIDDALAGGARVTVHDPQALNNCVEKYKGNIVVCDDMYEAARGADALVLCTEWRQYRNPNVAHLKSIADNLVVFDGRNVWDKRDFDAVGMRLISLVRRFDQETESKSTLHSINHANDVTNGSSPKTFIDPLKYEIHV